jgi:hypothetical protein
VGSLADRDEVADGANRADRRVGGERIDAELGFELGHRERHVEGFEPEVVDEHVRRRQRRSIGAVGPRDLEEHRDDGRLDLRAHGADPQCWRHSRSPAWSSPGRVRGTTSTFLTVLTASMRPVPRSCAVSASFTIAAAM